MSEEEDILRNRLKGIEPEETSDFTPTPVPKSNADKNYKMPVPEPKEVQEESDFTKAIEDAKKDVLEEKRSSEQEKQAAYFNQLKDDQKTEEPAVEVTTDSPEPETVKNEEIEKNPPLPPTPIVDCEVDDRLSKVEYMMHGFVGEVRLLKKAIAEKDEEIELLSQANADLFSIDMQSLAEELNNFRSILLDIGDEKYYQEIFKEEKLNGPHMAQKLTMRFYDEARMHSREGLPIITAIEVIMNKFNEKLKYSQEA